MKNSWTAWLRTAIAAGVCAGAAPLFAAAPLGDVGWAIEHSEKLDVLPLRLESGIRLNPVQGYAFVAGYQSKKSPRHWEIFAKDNQLNVYIPGFTPEILSSDFAIADGVMHHVVMDLTPERCTVSVDGKPVIDAQVALRDPAAKPTDEGLFIGRVFELGGNTSGEVEYFRLLKGGDAPELVGEWIFTDPGFRSHPESAERLAPAMRCPHDGNVVQNRVKMAPPLDVAPLQAAAERFLKESNLEASRFPMLASRNAVWEYWHHGLKFHNQPEYSDFRRLGDFAKDEQWRERIAKQTFNKEALAGAAEDAAASVLRRTNALLAKLSAEYPARQTEWNRLTANGKDLAAALEKIPAGDSRREDGYYALCAWRREVVFANPLFRANDSLITASRGVYEGGVRQLSLQNPFTKDDNGGHFVNQFFGYNAIPGGGIFKVEQCGAGGTPKVTDLLANSVVENGRFKGQKLNFGAFATPDVDYDGKRVVFAWTPNADYAFNIFSQNTCFHIFTVNADGTNLRQLTDGAYEDFDPCFLPNGRIAFVSTRRGGYIRCFAAYIKVPNYTMFSMRDDGTDIVPMSYFETAEWNPVVNRDGMITFTRWDYTDRENCIGARFWIANPDGTNPRAPHGNYPFPYTSDEAGKEDFLKRFPDLPYTGLGSRLNTPFVEMGIRQIPESDKYVMIAAPHHGGYFGSVCVLDLNVPDDGHHSQVKRVTPLEPYPESEMPMRLHYNYGQPWPLSEDFYIVNSWENVIALDSMGNQELIVSLRETEGAPDDRFRLTEPIPLLPRQRPPVIPQRAKVGSMRSPNDAPATLAVMNVYDSDQPLPEGTVIKHLRIVQNVLKTNNAMGEPMIGFERENTPRIPLGIVPVEPDGSVYMEAPVAKELIFQLLDEEGNAVQSMRSVAFVFPGEQLTCQGCHEPTDQVPEVAEVPMALRRAPSKLQKETPAIEPISFYRQIKPLLEKAGYDVSEYTNFIDNTFWFSGGMWGNMIGDYCKEHGGSRSVPGNFGARVAKLAAELETPEKKALLTDAERKLIRLWLDCNSLQYGAFFRTVDQQRGELVWPILDVDPANPAGIAGGGAELKHNFWHENNYGPYPMLVASHTRNAVMLIDREGNIVWEYPVAHPQDVWILENGNVLISSTHAALEVTRDKEIVWEYRVDAPNEIPNVQPLPDGRVLVGICGQCRLVELENGREVHSIQLATPVKAPHEHFRMCRKTPEGTYLVPFTAEGALREYDRDGNVIREFPPLRTVVNAIRLPDGNTLVSAAGKVTEFDPQNRVVWEIDPRVDTPDIVMAIPAGIQRLPNGNTLVCNWNTRNNQDRRGAHIFEITPDKRVVWEFLRDDFGQVAQCQVLTDDFQIRKDITWR